MTEGVAPDGGTRAAGQVAGPPGRLWRVVVAAGRPGVAVTSLVLISAALGLWLAWRPLDYLIGHLLVDDAFYYFQTARNIVNGQGVSVDGEVWANGFHPLWMVLLLPVYALFGDDQAPIHVALSVSTVVTASSGALLYLTARRLGLSPWVAVAVAAAYLFHPVVIALSLNGLETGLNVSLGVALVYVWVVAWQDRSPGRLALVSGVSGLLILSRTDYAIFAGPVLLALFAKAPGVRPALALAIPLVLMTLPWWLWNVVVFGSPVQASADAIPYVAHEVFRQPGVGTTEVVGEVFTQLRRGAFESVPYFYFAPSQWVPKLGAGLSVAAVPAAIAVAWMRSSESRRRLLLLGPPAAGLLALFLVHAGVRWYLREWYFAALLPLLALLFGIVLEEALASTTRRFGVSALASVVLLGTVPMAVSIYGSGRYPAQYDMLEAARWIEAETPRDTRVGAFNAGIVAYFDDRVTVNLDGVMNPDAYQALRDRRLLDYMRERQLAVLADFPFYPLFFYRSFLGAEPPARELASFGRHADFQGPFTVYALDGPARAR